MKRHIGLQPLSHDHHEGLVHAARMTQAAQGKKDPRTVAADYLAFWPDHLMRHFREEEEVLAPLLEEIGGQDDPQRTRLLEEHRTLLAMSRDLGAAYAASAPLTPLLERLGRTLEAHIRFEEREMFPRLEQALPDERLAALAEHLSGGPSCGLPN